MARIIDNLKIRNDSKVSVFFIFNTCLAEMMFYHKNKKNTYINIFKKPIWTTETNITNNLVSNCT